MSISLSVNEITWLKRLAYNLTKGGNILLMLLSPDASPLARLQGYKVTGYSYHTAQQLRAQSLESDKSNFKSKPDSLICCVTVGQCAHRSELQFLPF